MLVEAILVLLQASSYLLNTASQKPFYRPYNNILSTLPDSPTSEVYGFKEAIKEDG